ncbi:MAG: inorganic diphosphatase [Spirochaetes bacterium]|nr:inorganic diphosphatase [Spirochaetota bacterium]
MIKVFVESESGTNIKNLYDEETYTLKRKLELLADYPFPYGFIIGTKTDDNDCVDCYILTQKNLKAGTMIECEPIGLLEQFEEHEKDHKVLAVLPDEKLEINQDIHDRLKNFIDKVFSQWPEVKVKVGQILDKETALSFIQNTQINQT